MKFETTKEFFTLTSIESPINRELIFDRFGAHCRSKKSKENTTKRSFWHQSWLNFTLKRDSMTISPAFDNCFLTYFTNKVVFRHSTKLWTARAITTRNAKTRLMVISARDGLWVITISKLFHYFLFVSFKFSFRIKHPQIIAKTVSSRQINWTRLRIFRKGTEGGI